MTATLTWDVPDELGGISLVAAVDQGGLDYANATETLQGDSLIEITDVSHEMLDRNTARFTVFVVNSGSENARAERVYANCNGVEFASEEFDLASGAETVATLDVSIPEDAFTESRTDTTITETAAVKVYTDGSITEDLIVRTGDAAWEVLINGGLGLVDRDGNSYTDSIQLTLGDLLLLNSDSVDTANAPQLTLSSDNEAVVSVTNGVLTAEKAGTAKIKVELYPAVDVYMTDNGDRMRAADAYYTLPSCLIQTRELTVQVSSDGSGSSGDGSYTPPTYSPTVVRPSEGGGIATVSPSNPKQGDTVTVTPKPDQGYEVDKITITDQNGKPVEVTVKPDGTYTFTQPVGKVKIEITYKPVQPVEMPWNNPFTDVAEGNWYYEAVRFVQELGLMNGYGDGRFGPNNNLSRAQLAQILFNKEGKPVVNYLMDFSDVSGEAWYSEAIRWATSQGIVDGYGNGRFGPNDPITREQLAVMLWRYSGSPAATDKELHFNDTDEISGFALGAMRWAVEHGIVTGYGDGRIDPRGQATRAQIAQMLKNFIENQEENT